MSASQQKWNRLYSEQADVAATVAEVLTQNSHLLPADGRALDLACGLGANTLFLAERGLTPSAWDISSVAIEALQTEALAQGFNIDAQVRDVITQPPAAETFEVIVVSHFLHRALSDSLIEALTPGGLLFYQTFCRQKVYEQGPKNPDYLLEDNELLQMFSRMKLRVYREEALLGDLLHGWRNQALLVAEKI